MLALILFALFVMDATYPVVAEAFALPESTSLSSAGQSVALIVRGPRSDLLAFASLARRERLHASVAVSGPLGDKDVAVLRAAGLDPIPALQTGGVGSWFDAREQLHRQTSRYGLHGRSTTAPTRGGHPRCLRNSSGPGEPAVFFVCGEQAARYPELV
jgi:hypothetical protein